MTNNKLTQEEITFLSESNKIERESGELGSIAMTDAIKAWSFAKKEFKKNKEVLSIPMILGIHKRLLQRLAPGYSGKIRECPVYIGGECRSQSKEEIISELNALCNKWNKRQLITRNSASLEEFEQQQKELFVKSWHIGYETCHPHSDGNGRTGRILMNLQRLKLEMPLLIIHEGEEQWNYYKWFKEDK